MSLGSAGPGAALTSIGEQRLSPLQGSSCSLDAGTAPTGFGPLGYANSPGRNSKPNICLEQQLQALVRQEEENKKPTSVSVSCSESGGPSQDSAGVGQGACAPGAAQGLACSALTPSCVALSTCLQGDRGRGFLGQSWESSQETPSGFPPPPAETEPQARL